MMVQSDTIHETSEIIGVSLKLKRYLLLIILRFETMVIGPMDTALGQLGASLQEELNLILQPLVEQIVIQSTQTCVDLCKARLSELLDENQTLGIPIRNFYTYLILILFNRSSTLFNRSSTLSCYLFVRFTCFFFTKDTRRSCRSSVHRCDKGFGSNP